MRNRLIVLPVVLVAAALVAVGYFGKRGAQDQISTAFAADYHLRHRPSVKIDGFPYLTQALLGTYDKVEVAISDWTSTPQNVEVRELRLQLHKVSASLPDALFGSGREHLLFCSATATALVPFDSIRAHAFWRITNMVVTGQELRLEGTLQGSLTLINVVVTARAQYVWGQGIVITPTSVSAPHGQDRLSNDQLRSRLVVTVPLVVLPGGAQPGQIQLTSAGVRVTASTDLQAPAPTARQRACP